MLLAPVESFWADWHEGKEIVQNQEGCQREREPRPRREPPLTELACLYGVEADATCEEVCQKIGDEGAPGSQ